MTPFCNKGNLSMSLEGPEEATSCLPCVVPLNTHSVPMGGTWEGMDIQVEFWECPLGLAFTFVHRFAIWVFSAHRPW